MTEGWVKLYRKCINTGWLKNHKLWSFWCWCLLKASHKECKVMVGYQAIELLPGQFIFGRKKASFELDLSEREIRTCLQHLKKMENLTIKSTNKFSIITIVNWTTYQDCNFENDQQNDIQTTSKRPANDHKQEVKNEKNERKDLKPSLHFEECSTQEFLISRKQKKLEGKRLTTFLLFWNAFGYKKGRAEAIDAWLEIPSLTNGTVEQIVEAAKKECLARPGIISNGRTPKMAQGWLTGRRWEDEDSEARQETWAERKERELAETERVTGLH